MEVSEAEHFFYTLFHDCSEDPAREGLKDTPKRFLKSFAELTRGYTQNINEVVNRALFACENTQPVIIERIPYHSLCEHHLLPFFGHCRMVYVPNGKVLGLSKIYRIVDLFSHRLQLQERLTHQIGETLQEVTQARGVYVEMTGEHLCVAMRGVQRAQSFMRTRYLVGKVPEDLLHSQPTHSPAVPLDSFPKQQLQLKSVHLPLFLGCLEEEQQRPTNVELSITLQFDKLLPSEDHLDDAVCYDTLIRYVKEQCLNQRYQLVEYACQQIYNTVHEFLTQQSVQAQVQVHLRKPLVHDLLQSSSCQISDF